MRHLLILWLILAGFAFAQELVEVPDQGFSITLTEGWTQEELREDFNNVFLRAASPVGIEDAAIYVQVYDLGRFTPESYRKSVRRYITTKMEGTVLSDKDVEVGPKGAWRIEYEGVSVGFAGKRRHFMNTVFFQGDKIYVVHCAARSQRWEQFQGDFTAISNSMNLEKS